MRRTFIERSVKNPTQGSGWIVQVLSRMKCRDVAFRQLIPQSVSPKLSDPRRSSSGCKDILSPSCVFRAEKEVQRDRVSCSHHRRLYRSSVTKSPPRRSRLRVRFHICNGGCRSRRCLSPTSWALPSLLSSLAWPKPHSPCASCRPEFQRSTLPHWPVFVWSCSLTMVRASHASRSIEHGDFFRSPATGQER